MTTEEATLLPPIFLNTLVAFPQPVLNLIESSSTLAGTPMMQYFGLAATLSKLRQFHCLIIVFGNNDEKIIT